jgi:phosphoglucosamine mutase
LEDEKVKKILKESNSILDGKGRILIRESGTEPLIRVMVEAEDEALLSQVIHDVVQAVQNVA